MAKVTSITGGLSVTKNLGDYNNIKPEWSETVEPAETDDIDEVRSELVKVVVRQIDRLLNEDI